MLSLAIAAVLLGLSAPATSEDRTHRDEVEAYRREREARVAGENGWLTVTGLFWLKEGANRLGSGPKNEVLLRALTPAQAGVLRLEHGRVTLEVAAGVAVTIDGQPIVRRELRSDSGGHAPDVVAIGPLRLSVIERGGRLAVRLRDPHSPARRAFRGLRWFPVREKYRVSGRFVPHATPKLIAVPNVLGMTERLESPGVVAFELDGKSFRLEPVYETAEKNELFLLFRDRTSGRESYPAGRFLYAALPRDGRVVLDFNKAFTPPCAFTKFATCPLPPPQNRLGVRLEAGELDDGVLAH